MAETQLSNYLQSLAKQHKKNLTEYVETFFDNADDMETLSFSNPHRDLENLKTEMWLACGEVALQSNDTKIKQSFIKEITNANLPQYDSTDKAI